MAGRGLRPELQAPPEIFYNETEARKYSQNSRMMEIQSKMAERALELLGLADGEVSFLLDVGCGSGLSGELLTERGHMWLGIDISTAMLTVAAERDVEGDVILADMGDGLPFRPGTFDGCISISAVQWLCYANKAVCSPPRRLLHFFSSLYACLKRGARAVFQLYPQNADQLELISSQAMKAGFSGGMVVDFPNSTKAKKFFLCLFSGGTASLPKALVDEDAQEGVQYTNSRLRYSSLKGKSVKKSRNWILEKKERQRRQGKDVRHNSKYTGRRRKSFF